MAIGGGPGARGIKVRNLLCGRKEGHRVYTGTLQGQDPDTITDQFQFFQAPVVISPGGIQIFHPDVLVTDFMGYGGLQFRGIEQVQSYIRDQQDRPLVEADESEWLGRRLVDSDVINGLPLVYLKHDAESFQLLPLGLLYSGQTTLRRQGLQNGRLESC